MESLLSPPLWLGVPFIAVLALMTVAPYAMPRFWHQFESEILFLLAVVAMGGLILTMGFIVTIHELSHVFIQDYLPFVILLSSLYIITTGVQINLKIKATPFRNTVFLAFGSLLASIVGTTGAAMILLRPFINMNSHRHHKTHSIIFFIFLVANIGGCLTPIGDPPLFLGYLNGVDFFWTLRNLIKPFLITVGILLGIYYLLDYYFSKGEKDTSLLNPCSSSRATEGSVVIQENTWMAAPPTAFRPDGKPKNPNSFSIAGKLNLLLLMILISIVIMAGLLSRYYPDAPSIKIMDQTVSLVQIITNVSLILLACFSYALTPKHIRHKQHFSWAPIREVARLFAIIFVTIIPISMMLKAGFSGSLASVLELTNHSSFPALTYFWLTGAFSAFLDNAPTYLLFFKMAGGEAQTLMTSQAFILMAISLGSVFMGAVTYIGNAPNLMVRTLAKQSGISMPGFIGYMAWSCVILLPIFLGVSLWIFL